jgi:hypothetical protein
MIKLDVKPYCHSCNDFEADVVKLYPGTGQLYETCIKCVHHERCAMLAEHIQKEMMDNDVHRKA